MSKLVSVFQLIDLQNKVRTEVCSEYLLMKKCTHPERQLFDWGMMRLRYPYVMYGIGDSFAMEADDRHRKKRDAEVCYFYSKKSYLFCTYIKLMYQDSNFQTYI